MKFQAYKFIILHTFRYRFGMATNGLPFSTVEDFWLFFSDNFPWLGLDGCCTGKMYGIFEQNKNKSIVKKDIKQLFKCFQMDVQDRSVKNKQWNMFESGTLCKEVLQAVQFIHLINYKEVPT